MPRASRGVRQESAEANVLFFILNTSSVSCEPGRRGKAPAPPSGSMSQRVSARVVNGTHERTPGRSFARTETMRGAAVARSVRIRSVVGPALAGLLCGFLAGSGASANPPEREREIERGDRLEDQIQSELKRQEELLEQMRAEEAARKDAAKKREPRAPAGARARADRADARIATR